MGVFTREETETLNYDKDAFFYFAGAALVVILLPWTFSVVYSILAPPLPKEHQPVRPPATKRKGPDEMDLRERVCSTEAMEAHRRQAQAARLAWKNRLRSGVKMQLFFLVVLWLCLAWLLLRLRSAEELRSFDPHDILGLDKTADEKEIKRAYRRKSLESHPDKNPDDPLAAANFQRVAKAYSALTSEQARRNYEKYGNPDGPTGMKLSVALHPALMEKENQLWTVVGFFIVLFFVVPACALYYYFRTKGYAPNGIHVETLQMLALSIDGATTAAEAPGLLCAAYEARTIWWNPWSYKGCQALFAILAELERKAGGGKLRNGCLVELHGLEKAKELNGQRALVKSFVKDTGRYELIMRAQSVQKDTSSKAIKPENLRALEPSDADCFFNDRPIFFGWLLLWLHNTRMHHILNEHQRQLLDYLLRTSGAITPVMVSVALNLPGDRSRYFEAARSLIEYQRSLVQALEIGGVPLLQLPHVKEDLLKSRKDLAATDLRAAAADPEELLRKLPETFGDQERLDIRLCLQHLPRVTLEADVFVEDEDVVAVDDVATLRVRLRRENLETGEAAGAAHAPLFPVPRYESWYVLVVDEHTQRLTLSDVIVGQGREAESRTIFQVPRHGEFQYRVLAMCDCYSGLDVETQVHFTALKQKDTKREIVVHPADRHIRSFFEEIMMGLQPPESDSESETDDERPPVPAAKAPATAPPAAEEEPMKVPQQVADSSEEEDEAIQEGFIYATGPERVPVYQEPRAEEALLACWCLPGRLIRGIEEVETNGDTFLLLGDGGQGYMQAAQASPEKVYARKLGPLMEQPLRHVVSTMTPLPLVRRWIKQAKPEQIQKEDLLKVGQFTSPAARQKIAAWVLDKLGSERYKALAGAVTQSEDRFDAAVTKMRGVWLAENGARWRVHQDLSVQMIQPNGERMKDRVDVQDEGGKECVLRLGPFMFDHARSTNCLCWVHDADRSKAMVWRPDRSLAARMQFRW